MTVEIMFSVLCDDGSCVCYSTCMSKWCTAVLESVMCGVRINKGILIAMMTEVWLQWGWMARSEVLMSVWSSCGRESNTTISQAVLLLTPSINLR